VTSKECTIADFQVLMNLAAMMKKLETIRNLLDDTPIVECFPALIGKIEGR
jgi:hypothetical protein